MVVYQVIELSDNEGRVGFEGIYAYENKITAIGKFCELFFAFANEQDILDVYELAGHVKEEDKVGIEQWLPSFVAEEMEDGALHWEIEGTASSIIIAESQVF